MGGGVYIASTQNLRLEIKIHMVGMEYLDLTTSVGGSLSKNVCWKCRHVLMALSMNEEWVEGYI